MSKKRFLPLIPISFSLFILLSFIPKEKHRKVKHPAEAPFGHVQSVHLVSYNPIIDSSGSIYKGDIINDTGEGSSGPAGENSIEMWRYDSYGYETEHDLCHANGVIYLRIIHAYKYDSKEHLLTTDQWYSYAPGYIIPPYTNTISPSFTRNLSIYDSTGKMLEEYSFLEDTVNPSSLKLYRYNESGKLIETDDSKIEGIEPENVVPAEKNVLFYDVKGRITDKVTYRFHRGLIKDEKTTYDSTGKTVKIVQYGQPNTVTRTFVKRTFKETHTIQEDTYDGNGMLLDYSISHFDSAKHLLDEGTFHVNYERPPGEDQGYTLVPVDTVMISHIVNDEHFNTVANDIFSDNGKPISQKTFLYTYDDMGNWVEKIILDNDKPVKIEEREIIYYKD